MPRIDELSPVSAPDDNSYVVVHNVATGETVITRLIELLDVLGIATDAEVAEAEGRISDEVAAFEGRVAGVEDEFTELRSTGAYLPGAALLTDSAGNVLLAWTPEGLDFIPNRDVADRVSVGMGQVELTLNGFPLMLDADENILLSFRETGIDFIPSDELKSRLGGTPDAAPNGSIYGYLNGDGNLVYGQLLDGGRIEQTTVIDGVPLLQGGASSEEVTMHVITTNGQSLSIGAMFTDVANAPVFDEGDDAFIINGLMDLSNDLTARGWLSRPYTDTAGPPTASGIRTLLMGNTPANPIATVAAPMSATINRYRREVGGRLGSVLTVSHGYSGVAWEQMDDDPLTGTGETVIWDNMTFWYQQAKVATGLVGVNLEVPWHVLVHGTSAQSVDPGVYYDFLDNYIADFRALMASESIPGEARLIFTQAGGNSNIVADWEVCLDQVRYCVDGKAILAGPLYPFPIADNNVHPDGENTLVFSEMISRAIAEVEAGRAWTPLNIREHRIEGGVLKLRFWTRDDESLQINSDRYGGSAISNAGFELDGATITGIAVAGDTVDISFTGTPTELRYAFQTQDVTGIDDGYVAHRGLLRTTYSWESRWGGTMYRWVPSQKITL